MVDKLQQIWYSMLHISYFDSLVDWAPLFAQNRVKQPFSEFYKVGEMFLKKLCNSFMEVNEPYMQASFQCHVDEGCTGWWHAQVQFIYLCEALCTTFGICTTIWASWTTTNLNDRISIEWLKFTKAQSEMEMIMQEYKVARINAGFPKLKHYETDNVQANWEFIERILPERKENVVPFQPNNLLPVATMDGEKIVYITTSEAANEYAKAIVDKFQGKEMVCYGLDAEVMQRIQLHFSIFLPRGRCCYSSSFAINAWFSSKIQNSARTPKPCCLWSPDWWWCI